MKSITLNINLDKHYHFCLQKNLYASGASDSEIFIWDLKNPGNPMTPGKKTEPLVPISCVAWNRQVNEALTPISVDRYIITFHYLKNYALETDDDIMRCKTIFKFDHRQLWGQSLVNTPNTNPSCAMIYNISLIALHTIVGLVGVCSIRPKA